MSAMRSYARIACSVFYRTNEDFGALSNMAAGYPLQIGDIKVPSSEALYQACRFPHAPEIQHKIIQAVNPMASKITCQPFKAQSRADWQQVRVKAMRWALRVKLACHYEDIGQLLLSSEDQPIVEESRTDSFWGAIPTPDSKEVLVGENVLGRLLMELREQFRHDAHRKLLTVEPPRIDNFLLLGRPVSEFTVALRPPSPRQTPMFER